MPQSNVSLLQVEKYSTKAKNVRDILTQHARTQQRIASTEMRASWHKANNLQVLQHAMILLSHELSGYNNVCLLLPLLAPANGFYYLEIATDV